MYDEKTEIKVPYEDFKGDEIGEKLRFVRECLGQTPEEFAFIADVQPHTYKNWEECSTNLLPGRHGIKRIAHYTKIPKEWFMPYGWIDRRDRKTAYLEKRRNNLIAALWPDGDQPTHDEINRRITEASKLIPKKWIGEVMVRYHVQGQDLKDIAADIKRSWNLVARITAEGIASLKASSRAYRIIKDGIDTGLKLDDSITELTLKGTYKSRLLSAGISSIEDLIGNFEKVADQLQMNRRFIGAVVAALEKNGVHLPEIKVATTSMDHFIVLYNILYPDAAISREKAAERIELAVEQLTSPRVIAMFKGYYFGTKTLTNIGTEFNITRERVRQILINAIRIPNSRPVCQNILRGEQYQQEPATLEMPVHGLNINKRLAETLRINKISDTGQLVNAFHDGRINNIRGIGAVKLRQLVKALKERGIDITPPEDQGNGEAVYRTNLTIEEMTLITILRTKKINPGSITQEILGIKPDRSLWTVISGKKSS